MDPVGCQKHAFLLWASGLSTATLHQSRLIIRVCAEFRLQEPSQTFCHCPSFQDWLKQAAKNAVASIKTASGRAAADDWACVRSEAFPSSENEYAYLPVSEFSDSTHTLPPDEEAAEAPLPGFPAAIAEAPGQPGGLPPDLDGQNPLMLFLRSLMPWADLGLHPQLGGGENGNGVQLNEEQLEQVQLQLQQEAYAQAQAEAERRGWARDQGQVQGLGQGLGRGRGGGERPRSGGAQVDGVVESDDEE